MWLNSGNMSVYAATLTNPHSMQGYITNYDDLHYYMNYKMIRGVTPKEEWKHSYTLRRVGLYVVGYPIFFVFGFYWGGEITSFLIVLFAFLYFIRFIRKKYGVPAAYAGMLLCSCYTGIMYWIGSPFAQNTIFPISVLVYIIMYNLENTENLKQAILWWILLGILFTGYDLFILFLPAVFFYYCSKRKWLWAFLSALFIFLPQVLVELALQSYGALAHNENKDLYLVILNAWLTQFTLPDFIQHLKELPQIFVQNILDTGFIVLPSLFLVIFSVAQIAYRFKLNKIETSLLLGMLWLWLFLNLAPTYAHHWQLRGVDMARIYQPLFIVMVMYIVRFANYLSHTNKTRIRAYFILLFFSFFTCVWLNTGGWFENKITQKMYRNFYRHSDDDAYLKNIAHFGKRPLGF